MCACASVAWRAAERKRRVTQRLCLHPSTAAPCCACCACCLCSVLGMALSCPHRWKGTFSTCGRVGGQAGGCTAVTDGCCWYSSAYWSLPTVHAKQPAPPSPTCRQPAIRTRSCKAARHTQRAALAHTPGCKSKNSPTARRPALPPPSSERRTGRWRGNAPRTTKTSQLRQLGRAGE